MKRIGNLYDNVCSFGNILTAFKKASKATKNKRETLVFFYDAESRLLTLKRDLEKGSYHPRKYRYFEITDPKPRTIAVAPFRDRVVHHAIVNVLEPIYERRFIFDSYATRKHKGTHKAVRRAQTFLRKNRFYFKTDIRKYFGSIDHALLMDIIKRKIKDKSLLALITRIIENGGENGRGLPIGNLTSQFFANCYLDVFDHWIKDQHREKYYIRYMDDLLFFSNDKAHLKDLREYCQTVLYRALRLELKAKATRINKRENGVSFLGTRVFPQTIRVKQENLKRSLKRLKSKERNYKKGIITQEALARSASSITGHLGQYDTLRLRRSIFG